jgi:hypothetical protein
MAYRLITSLISVWLLLTTGCESARWAPSVTAMVPSELPPATVVSRKTLLVGGVKGGQKTTLMSGSKIEDSGFRDALLETLRKSGLFINVVVAQEKEVDYRLDAEILSQEMLPPPISPTSTLYVRYVLTDLHTNGVWSENIFSKYNAAIEIYGDRTANEGAVRSNLMQFVMKLSKYLGQQQNN